MLGSLAPITTVEGVVDLVTGVWRDTVMPWEPKGKRLELMSDIVFKN